MHCITSNLNFNYTIKRGLGIVIANLKWSNKVNGDAKIANYALA